MVDFINAELYLFLEAVLLGAILSFVYDCLRIIRRIIPCGKIINAIEDILFFIGAAVTTFIMLYKSNGGIIRWYVIVGILLGIILYYASIGQLYVKYTAIAINKVIDILTKPFKIIRSFIKKIVKTIIKGLKKFVKPIKIEYTNTVAKRKIKKEIKKNRSNIKNGKNKVPERQRNKDEKRRKKENKKEKN